MWIARVPAPDVPMLVAGRYAPQPVQVALGGGWAWLRGQTIGAKQEKDLRRRPRLELLWQTPDIPLHADLPPEDAWQSLDVAFPRTARVEWPSQAPGESRLALPRAEDYLGILSQHPFPLRLPVRSGARPDQFLSLTESTEEVLATKGDFLLRWGPNNSGGAEVLDTDLPGWATEWFARVDEDTIRLIRRGWQVAEGEPANVVFLCDVHPRTGWRKVQILRSSCKLPVSAFAEGDLAYVLDWQRAAVFDVLTGHCLGEMELPPNSRWSHGRYFSVPNEGWHELHYDGRKLASQPVPLTPGVAMADVLVVFRDWDDGAPWLMTRDGRLFQQERLVLCLRRTLTGFRLDKRLLHLEVVGQESWRVGRTIEFRPGGGVHLWPYAVRDRSIPLPEHPVRVHFKAMSVADRRLRLYSQSHNWVEYWWNNDGRAGFRKVVFTPESFAVIRRFETYVGYGLREAVWPNGRRAWLDDKGLLHLRPAQTGFPEVSVVLSEKSFAAWASDGTIYGPSFFTGGAPCIPCAEMGAKLQACLD